MALIKNPTFETVECSRCNGSGKFSWNARTGSTCFKCSGQGRTLTKKGAAAQKYAETLCEKLISEVVVGDFIRIDSITHRYFGKVVEISEPRVISTSNITGEEHMGIELTTEHSKMGRSGLITSPNSIIRIGQTKDQKQAKRELALAFQATLTKQGKVSKRKVAVA